MLKRVFDFTLSLILITLLFPLMLIIAIIIKSTSRGAAVFWSSRVGQYSATFRMPKFRTMKIDTPNVATHLLVDSKNYITLIGGFLRKTSLDELPQLWSILVGDMSFVGPRPALYNQEDLIYLRKSKGVDQIRPGLTGWAQVNGRDELPVSEKVNLDEYYFQNRSLFFDFKILALTLLVVVKSRGISH